MSAGAQGGRRHVWVIGGSRGIGAACARHAAASGFDVTVTSRQPEGPAAQIVSDLISEYPEGRFAAAMLDVADRGEVADFAAAMGEDEATYGLVYAAGQTYDMLAANVDLARAEELMQVNFLAMMALAGAAMRPMIRARAGRIVAIGSVTADHGTSGNSSYAATKGAMLGYIRTLAVEVARKGVTANLVAPGFIRTQLIADYKPYFDQMARQIPAGRLGEADEVGALVGYLLSPPASYVNGSVLTIDGGLSANLISRRP